MKNSWDEQYVEYEVGKSAFKAVTDSIVDTQSAIKVLAITVTAELGAFAMFYFGKNQIYKFLESGDNVWVYAAIGTFLLGFLTAFAGLRLVPYRFRRRLLTYTVWGISVASGLANIALFYVLLTLRMR